jgi:sugar lactone lactonase YvrE
MDSRISRLTALPLVAWMLAGTLTATGQSLQGGDFVTASLSNKTVFSVSRSGVVTTLISGSPLVQPTGLAVTATPEVIVTDYAGTLYRIPSPGTIVQVVAGISGPIRVAVDQDGDLMVTSLTGPALLSVTPGGVISTIFSGLPFRRPFGVAVDGSGDYLVADDSVDALFRVTPGGRITTVHQGLPFRLPQGVAVRPDGDFAVSDGIVDAIFRVARGGGAVVTLIQSPPLGNPDGITEDFEGRIAVSESGNPLGDRLVEVDVTGSLSTISAGAPFSNLEDLSRIPRLTGPNLGRAGQKHRFLLRFPGEGGLFYVMFACFSLYPGFGLPSPDVRATPCNPDPLFFLTLGANNPIFTRWAGVLSATGLGTPELNAPNVTLPPGLKLFIQAVTIDPTAPSGIRSLSNVHVIGF